VRLLTPRSPTSVRRALDWSAQTAPTYLELGATLKGARPAGYHHHHFELVIGDGRETFARAVEGLRSWHAHRVPGVRVLPAGAQVDPGATVLVVFGTALLAVAAPCRIIEVVEQEDRWGFAYGTLPGHPECGEEAFVVSLTHTGEVRFEVTAFSRPSGIATRLAGPLGNLMQLRITKSYLRALAKDVAR
jgi:uncharacterized protein (UPF0548 family)